MNSRLIALIFVLSLTSMVFGQLHQVPDSSAVTGLGKVFEITNSQFLNITVESSNDIFAYVQSIPQQITINAAKPKPEILSTILTIRNLIPEKNYYLTKNGNTETIVTDKDGVYACDLDLSMPQKILINIHQ